ncbi:hypothetical protein H4R99_005654 [Coemansia sp. RSA 1722]|nr:hypothetical protein H4R99_005654 [Coemansia sp. RSA 1722]
MGLLRQEVSRGLLGSNNGRHQLLSTLCERIWTQVNTGNHTGRRRASVHTSRRHSNTDKSDDNDDRWSRAMAYKEATDLVARFDNTHKTTTTKTNGRASALGRSMPSTVMRGVSIPFYNDIRRHRQIQGKRARVFAALADLQLLIQTTDISNDDGRVFWQLELVNQRYLEWLRFDRVPGLLLRGGTSVCVNGDWVAVGSDTQPQMMARSTVYEERANAPSFARREYEKRGMRKGSNMRVVDPVAAGWVDYLAADLNESDLHALFALVARSRVPDGALAQIRPAIEEALAFAYTRRGLTLNALESMRICMYFLRRQGSGVHVRQLQRLWQYVGNALVAESNDAKGFDLEFKRWNNVASQILMVLVHGERGVIDAWAALAQWHTMWTCIMRRLCPVPRRAHPDGLSFPYWRPKQPGRTRLHELTLDVQAINALLSALARDGHVERSIELLGLATSEAGVRLTTSLFNVVINALASSPAPQKSYALPTLSLLLPLLANKRAPTAYALPLDVDAGADAHVALVVRAMERWRVPPDARTLEIVATLCCRREDIGALCEALRMFAKRWGVAPSQRCWINIQAHSMYDVVHEFFVRSVQPVLAEKRAHCADQKGVRG